MIDKYCELSDLIKDTINLLKVFHDTKDDFKKPLIRANQQKIISLGKIINSSIKEKTFKLADDIDEYLANLKNDCFLNLMHDATQLNNSLWEI